MTQKKERRLFSEDFKNQIFQLYVNGKSKSDIAKEYDLSLSVLNRWIKQAQSTGSFKEKDNRTPDEIELIKLRKENQQLKIENDILKQAALIMARK